RGRSVPEARTILAFTERAAAVEVEKVLSSAVANAESNPALHWRGDDLVVHAVYVDEGPTLKRWRARARGRVARIRKRTCHITIREHILKKLSHAGLSDILIRKDKQRITIDIYTARPGIVIGKSGVEVDALRKEVHAMTQKNVHININEIKRPELDAKLVAQS